jgi:6,7-dimethyl-8-ribityllumazine synthase
MPKTIEANLNAAGKKFGIIASRFNDFIVGKLVDGAVDALTRSGAEDKDITVLKVPGAFEIPLVAQKMAAQKKYDAIICLGAVIRGATTHYDYVCAEVSKGIAAVSLETQCSCHFRYRHHGNHRTGHRTRRYQSRETRGGARPCRPSNGQSHGYRRQGVTMGTRRLSREQALQALFYMDMHRDPVEDPSGLLLQRFYRGQPR